jgi:SAM-dependent methyltransferase
LSAETGRAAPPTMGPSSTFRAPNPGALRAPSTYVLGYEDAVVDKLAQRHAEREAAFLLPFIPLRGRVLDAGCGPGSITLGLARMLPAGSVIGVDLDEGQVARARRAAEDGGVSNARFEVADVTALPFPDASFDVVFAHTVMMHLADPRAALAEMCRVCKPGGVVGLRDGLGSFDHLPGFPADAKVKDLQELLTAATRASGGTPDVGVHLRGWLHALGMQVVQSQACSVVYDAPEDLALLRDWHRSLLQGKLGQIAVAEGLISMESLAGLLDRMGDWPDDRGAISVVVWIEHVAAKPIA